MPKLIAGDVVEMRAAIAKEKGDRDRWDLKYAAGGLVDLEFIAQYLQLVHAQRSRTFSTPRPRACSTRRWALGRAVGGRCRRAAAGGAALSQPDADPAAVPAGAVRSEDRGGRAAAAAGARGRRAGFRHARCDAVETQAKVRESFVRILGKARRYADRRQI